MSFAQTESVTIATNASGDATAYTTGVFTGRVVNIIYTKDTYDNGVDFTITTDVTGQNLWVDTNVNASETVAPMQPTHDSTGAASLYAAAGEPVETGIYCVNERIKFVVAQGGNTKSGSFRVIIA